MLWTENAGVFDPVCMAILAGYEQAGSTKVLAIRSFSLILQLVLFHDGRHTLSLRDCFAICLPIYRQKAQQWHSTGQDLYLVGFGGDN